MVGSCKKFSESLGGVPGNDRHPSGKRQAHPMDYQIPFHQRILAVVAAENLGKRLLAGNPPIASRDQVKVNQLFCCAGFPTT